MENEQQKGSLFGATALIAGTTIGAGMLGLPLATATCGLLPALVATLLTWIFMLTTGFYFLEAVLGMPKGANLISTSRTLLGPYGSVIATFAFLLLYYALMVAYLAAAAPLFALFAPKALATSSFRLFLLLFFSVVVLGAKAVDHLNRLFLLLLLLSFFSILALGIDQVSSFHTPREAWEAMPFALPTLFGAFGYHNVIPSIADYLKQDRKKIQWAIVVGTFLPCLAYISWLVLIHNIIPSEELMVAKERGIPISNLLLDHERYRFLRDAINLFSLSAITTSLLGVALSMVDFIADGIGFPLKNLTRRALLTALVFVPPAMIAGKNPEIFLFALNIAGGFGEALLNGLLPALLLLSLLYLKKRTLFFPRLASLPLLLIIVISTLFVMATESYSLVWQN